MDIKEIRRAKLKEFFKNRSIPIDEKSYLSQLMGGEAPLERKRRGDLPSDEMVYVKESRISFAAGNGRIASYELIEDEEPAGYRSNVAALIQSKICNG